MKHSLRITAFALFAIIIFLLIMDVRNKIIIGSISFVDAVLFFLSIVYWWRARRNTIEQQ